MTLLLSSRTGPFMVLAADRRVQVKYPNGSEAFGDEPKLFVVGNSAIACIGHNPTGVHVPTAIASLQSPHDAWALAIAAFGALTPSAKPGDMSALVIGPTHSGLQLLEIKPTIGIDLVPVNPGTVILRGSDPSTISLGLELELEQVVETLLDLLRQATAQSKFVGPPYDFAIVGPDVLVESLQFSA